MMAAMRRAFCSERLSVLMQACKRSEDLLATLSISTTGPVEEPFFPCGYIPVRWISGIARMDERMRMWLAGHWGTFMISAPEALNDWMCHEALRPCSLPRSKARR